MDRPLRSIAGLAIACSLFCWGVELTSRESKAQTEPHPEWTWEEPGGLAREIAAGMRAISIPVNEDRAAGGFVTPGCTVNVIGGPSQTNPSPAKVLFRNRRVLGVDNHALAGKWQRHPGRTAPEEPKGVLRHPNAYSVTLEVTPDEAQSLLVAAASFPLHLVVVNAEVEGSEE